jgi:uncharacterized Zn finger protein
MEHIKMYCTYCGSKKHTVVNCPKTWGGSVRHAHLHCNFCGAKDHDIQACPKTWNGNAKRAWNPESIEDHFVLDK